MEMTFGAVLQILWRWKWLIIGFVTLTGAGLAYQSTTTEVSYEASTTLQITTPDREDATLTDDYIFVSDRDEITVALNNFLEIAESPEIFAETKRALDLPEDYEYSLSVSAERGSDLVYIDVETSEPEHTSALAITHANMAVARFGTLRSQPAKLAADHLRTQLDESALELEAAEDSLIAFQKNHNVGLLDQELSLEQDLLEQLENRHTDLVLSVLDSGFDLEKQLQQIDNDIAAIDSEILAIQLSAQEQRLLELNIDLTEAQAADALATNANAELIEQLEAEIIALESEIANTESALEEQSIAALEVKREVYLEERATIEAQQDPSNSQAIAYLDTLIEAQEQRIFDLSLLEPEYNLLQLDIELAQEKYQLLTQRYNETDLRQEFARQAFFIQVVELPDPVGSEIGGSSNILLLGIIASAGFSILLSFGLEYLLPKKKFTPEVEEVWAATYRFVEDEETEDQPTANDGRLSVANKTH